MPDVRKGLVLRRHRNFAGWLKAKDVVSLPLRLARLHLSAADLRPQLSQYLAYNFINLIGQEIIAVIYGLASAVSWGAGDFSGGFATKTCSVYGVLLVANVTGLLLLSIGALLLGSPVPDLYFLLLGAAAGIFYFLGLAALYKSLASGLMGIVAPLTAVVAAVLPILFSTFSEGLPSSLQALGFMIAFLAIWLLSVPEKSRKVKWPKFGLPVAAGFCFGLTFIFIDGAADQGVLWPLVAARCAGMAALIIFLVIFRSSILPPRNKYPLACLSGIFDTAGTALFALAAQTGRLDISAVLASMYPATTVLFARLILKERLAPRQWIGVAVALFALALIAV